MQTDQIKSSKIRWVFNLYLQVQICTHIPTWAGWSTVKIFCCHKNNSERRSKRHDERQAWQCKRCKSKSYSLHLKLSKHLILDLVTACGNQLLLFVMQCEASLQNPQHSHTRGSSFISRPLLLSDLTDGGTSPSFSFTSHGRTPCVLFGVGNSYRLETGRKKYKKNIMTVAKKVFGVTQREHKHVRCSKERGPR